MSPKMHVGNPLPQCDGVGRWCRGPLGSDQVTRKEPPGCGRRRSGSPGEHPGPSAPGHAAGRCLCARAAPAPEAPAPAPDPGLPASRTATVNVHVPTAPSPCVVTAARRRDSLPRGPRRAFRSKRDRGRRPGAERSLPGTGGRGKPRAVRGPTQFGKKKKKMKKKRTINRNLKKCPGLRGARKAEPGLPGRGPGGGALASPGGGAAWPPRCQAARWRWRR